ncbi:MAG: hypothetical protein ACREO4_06390 [Lysobacter sp.]
MSDITIKLAPRVDLQIKRSDSGRIAMYTWLRPSRRQGSKIVGSVHPKASDVRVYLHDGAHTLQTDEALFYVSADDVAAVCEFLGIQVQSA